MDEKSAFATFNLCGASALNEKQIKNLETTIARLLGEQHNEYAKHWTKEVIKMTLETNNQTLADPLSIPLDTDKSSK